MFTSLSSKHYNKWLMEVTLLSLHTHITWDLSLKLISNDIFVWC